MSIFAQHLSTSLKLAACVASLTLVATLPIAAFEVPTTDDSTFATTIRPLLETHCFDCHSTRRRKGDLDLQRFKERDAVRAAPRVWESVAAKVRLGEMPPPDEEPLSEEQRDTLVAWIESELDAIAAETAGDPGPVVLRRLSNAEYTYTLRDLTGVASLDPAREFPVDGAAGEGFTNVGNALVMSPTLFDKYFGAAKGIANHAMLVEDGIRFAAGATRRDQTEELLGAIREFYRRYTDPGGGEVVNLQGIVFTTNAGGRLPLEKYFAATLELRGVLAESRAARVDALARAHGLSPKYLAILLSALTDSEPSPLLDPIRARWAADEVRDFGPLVADIGAWQKSLWKFNSVGHIGKAGGPKGWMEAVDPLVDAHELRIAMPAATADDTITIELIATDAGDGATDDVVDWREPRFIAPGKPDLLLRDVRAVAHERRERRARLLSDVESTLAAVAAVDAAIESRPEPAFDTSAIVESAAQARGIARGDLEAWLAYLGLGALGPASIESCFTEKLERPSEFDFITGWGSAQTPLVLANSSGRFVQIPGDMKPHSIAVHPSPTQRSLVAWRSPVATAVRVEAKIQHAHLACGNGVEWSLEVKRGVRRSLLASGIAQDGTVQVARLEAAIPVRVGDVVMLAIGPRDGEHTCDLTAVDLTLTNAEHETRVWDLAADCSPDLTSSNPHADRFGNAGVWSFATEPVVASEPAAPIPPGSSLSRWLLATDTTERARYAAQLARSLANENSAPADAAEAALLARLRSLDGPLLARATGGDEELVSGSAPSNAEFGLDPARFGVDPDGRPLDAASLSVRAPSVVSIEIPAQLVAGREFVTVGALAPSAGTDGSVQLAVRIRNKGAPAGSEDVPGLVPSEARVADVSGPWTSNDQRIQFAEPVIVREGSAGADRMRAAFERFRRVFPAALCYTKIVPVDEVVTLTQFHREDSVLAELMLDDEQARRLDRLWSDLHFVAQDALTQVDAFEQIYQFATQDADPSVFEPMRQPIREAADAFRAQVARAEPRHLEAALEFAGRAWRRPLSSAERDDLLGLYPRLRESGLTHDEAVRLMLARILVAPAFLYRREVAPPGTDSGAISDFELASRLSYFLWSSVPDEELRAAALAGRLRDDVELLSQTRRMLRDPRVRRLATEFGCAWLHVSGFDEHAEKSERHFPTFVGLRGAMHEEVIRFFTEFFRTDSRVRELLDADHTFLDESLAAHYGIAGVVGAEWRRVDGMRAHGRGGILGFGATLAAQSGASRTSPILRGNWVSEVLLGERLPRPPKDVPQLPADEGTESLSVRQMVERHSKDPSCVVCHQRIDAFGFALEGFDAIGRRREVDLGGHPIDTVATLRDGMTIDGLPGLREYLATVRKDAFDSQFCRKLLGYALGRAVQLSDRPLLRDLTTSMRDPETRISNLVTAIVSSRQFRSLRGRDADSETSNAEPEVGK